MNTFTEQTINNMTLDELVHYIDNGDIPCHPAILTTLRDCLDDGETIETLIDEGNDLDDEVRRLNRAMDLVADALENADTDEEAIKQAHNALYWTEGL